MRLGQWPRTIRDFSDDSTRRSFRGLAEAYKKFAAALPLPPGGSDPLEVVVLNEPNNCGEWQCAAGTPGSRLYPNESAAEVATCLRDILTALRPLPRLMLSAAPTAFTVSPYCSCDGAANPVPDWNTPTDIGFMKLMLEAVPDLYTHTDFFNSHSYPFGVNNPFSSPLGRAGAVHYRAQLNATMHPERPVLITETGWRGPNETDNAVSTTAAFEQEWLPDKRVQGVMPYLLSTADGSPDALSRSPWVQWSSDSKTHRFKPVYNATKDLRCRIGVGGMC